MANLGWPGRSKILAIFQGSIELLGVRDGPSRLSGTFRNIGMTTRLR